MLDQTTPTIAVLLQTLSWQRKR